MTVFHLKLSKGEKLNDFHWNTFKPTGNITVSCRFEGLNRKKHAPKPHGWKSALWISTQDSTNLLLVLNVLFVPCFVFVTAIQAFWRTFNGIICSFLIRLFMCSSFTFNNRNHRSDKWTEMYKCLSSKFFTGLKIKAVFWNMEKM